MKVAILTPRAGVYNHRWIVADKEIPELERLLSDWLEKLKADSSENPNMKHGILLNSEVRQESSGRVGEEYLFLYDEKFHQLEHETRAECLNILKAWRSQNIERVVQHVGNSQECETSLICVNGEVNELEKKLDRIVPNSHRGFVKRSHYKRVLISMITVLIIATAAFGLNDNGTETKSEKTPKGHSITLPLLQPDPDEKRWTQLRLKWEQYGFLMDKKGQPLLQDRITKELLEFIYLNNIGTADWKSCDPPQKVNELLVLSSSKIQEEDKPQWDILSDVDPVQFRKCVREYRKSHDMGDLKLWNYDEKIQLNFFVNQGEYSDAEIMKNMQIAWNEEVLELAKEHIFEPKVESKIGSDYQDDVRAKFNTDTQNASDAIAELGRFVRFSNGEPEFLKYSVDGEKLEFDPPATPLSRQEVIDNLAKLPGEVCPEWIIEFSKLLDDKRTP